MYQDVMSVGLYPQLVLEKPLKCGKVRKIAIATTSQNVQRSPTELWKLHVLSAY